MTSDSGLEGSGRPARWRLVVFWLLVAGCTTAAVVYVISAALDDESGDSRQATGAGAKRAAGRQVIFQNVAGTAAGDEYAKVALDSLDRPGGRRTLVDLTCERVYFAAGRGLCLVPERSPIKSSYKAKITDGNFKTRHEIEIAGAPSRARISPDGRWGATTAFVAGHSYLASGFSTQTLLIDMTRGSVVADLEKDFAVTRNGRRFKEVDFNFWGVTFTRDGRRFYATLRTGGQTYLLEGNIRSRQARVLHENVECPSLSPDETRVAYKRRVKRGWRLHVLDLDSMHETRLAEARSVDDQAEWLDDELILYGIGADTWIVRADGRGSPRRYLSKGLSPAVVRN